MFGMLDVLATACTGSLADGFVATNGSLLATLLGRALSGGGQTQPEFQRDQSLRPFPPNVPRMSTLGLPTRESAATMTAILFPR